MSHKHDWTFIGSQDALPSYKDLSPEPESALMRCNGCGMMMMIKEGESVSQAEQRQGHAQEHQHL